MSLIKKKLTFADLNIEQTAEWIYITGKRQWKTLSSAVLGGGFAFHDTFVNRHVNKNYRSNDPIEEFHSYLQQKGINDEVLAMMTAARLEDAVIIRSKEGAPSILSVVSVGVGNALDVSQSYKLPDWEQMIDTINILIFIEGTLPESTYVQAMMTATEAKVKALFDENIRDPHSGTHATGTSTDSVMIAATEEGSHYPYAGSITVLGKEIGRVVYEATRKAIKNYKMRKEKET